MSLFKICDAINCRGLTARKVAILLQLEHGQGKQLKNIASAVGVTSGGMTGLLNTLEKEGFITRMGKDPANKRHKVDALTEQGTNALRYIEEAILTP